MTEALPPLIAAGVVLILLLTAIGRAGYISRQTKFLLAAFAAAVTGFAVVVYGALYETNYVACDPTFGKCAAHIEAQPILVDAGLGLLVLALVLAIVAIALLVRRVFGGDRG